MSVQTELTKLANKIRYYTRKTAKMKLDGMPAEIETVYKAGQNSVIDESKIIEKTATGTGVVALDDVSEIPHDISVQLSGENVGGKQVKVCGKNLFKTNNYTKGSLNANNGQPSGTSTQYCVITDYIEVAPNTSYKVSNEGGANLRYICFYNRNKEFISNTWTNRAKSFTFATNDCAYIRIDVERSGNALIENFDTFFADYKNMLSTYGGEYEPYIDNPPYTTNADGKIEGIKSISPYMTLICDDADISMDYHKSYGMQTEYDRFWDASQDNGRRTNYNYGFAGDGWDDEAFKPKYDLIGASYVNNLFQSNNTITTISCIIDFTKLAGTAQGVFQNAPKLRTIKEIIVNENTNINSNCFQSTSSLEEIHFSGVIAKDLNLSSCPKLNAEDAANIISDNLKYLEGDEVFTKTIYLHANVWEAIRNWIQETGGSGYEIEQLCDDKGWNRV